LQPEPDHREAAARYLASAASGCKPAEHHGVDFLISNKRIVLL
jgi:hypothetical protein